MRWGAAGWRIRRGASPRTVANVFKAHDIEPEPSGFKPLAGAELLEPGENWALLALADGKLFMRDQKNLKCLVVAQQGR